MKKINYLVLGASAILLLAACNFSFNDTNPIKGANRKGVYAYEAATSAHLLTEVTQSVKLNALEAPLNENETKNEVEDATIEKVKEYLPTVEAALTGDEVLSSYQESVSDRPEYQYMMSVTYTDILLAKQEMVMYYNEFVEGEENLSPDTSSETTTEETKTSDEVSQEETAKLHLLNDDEEEDEDEEDLDDEKESRIEGIVIINGETYNVEGEKESENGGELEVSFRYMLSETNYIEVEQEIEADEYEFKYSIIENNEVVHEYEIEVEKDEVELKLRDAELGKYKMKFELVTVNDKNLIRCKLKDGKTKTVLDFEKVTNTETGVSEYVLVK